MSVHSINLVNSPRNNMRCVIVKISIVDFMFAISVL